MSSLSWKHLTFVLVGIWCAGCASVDYGLYKPGGTEEEFNRDASECRRSVGLGEGRYNPSQMLAFVIPRYKEELRSCLHEKGWKLRPDAV